MAQAHSTTRGTTVCVFSSHSLVLQQWRRLLEGSNFKLRVQKVSASAFADENITVPPAKLYVVDADCGMSAHRCVATILKRRPNARTLVISEGFTEVTAFPLLKLGVKGLLKYEDADDQLLHAIQAVGAGGYWVPRNLLSRFVDIILRDDRQLSAEPSPGPAQRVSARERQVMNALLQNLSNKEIATKLFISERTVKFHVSNLLSKFGVQRRADLIVLWFQHSQREITPQPLVM